MVYLFQRQCVSQEYTILGGRGPGLWAHVALRKKLILAGAQFPHV